MKKVYWQRNNFTLGSNLYMCEERVSLSNDIENQIECVAQAIQATGADVIYVDNNSDLELLPFIQEKLQKYNYNKELSMEVIK